MKVINISIVLFITLIISCKKKDVSPENLISKENISIHIQELASDEFLGRKPGTVGEEKTTTYIKDQLMVSNVLPANGSSYFQNFSIKKVSPLFNSNLHLSSQGKTKEYHFGKSFYANTSFAIDEKISIKDVEMVFVGFGIVSEYFKWDDYRNKDVKGKIVVVLHNDPGFYTKDPKQFKGIEPSYFGGLKHKKSEALKRGAIGLFEVYSADDWKTLMNDANAPIFIEGKPELASDGLKFSGQISSSVMKQIILNLGNDFNYIEKALSKDFSIIPLKTKASLSLESTSKNYINTKNVVGLIKGKKHPDEYVIYTAHWDHLGVKENYKGKDSIFNGAIDNASGTAMQLEVAKTFSNLNNKPERSIIFLFTSAEEMGLLGAEYYANNPLYPLHKTVCVINADASFAVERMRMVVNVTERYTEMDSIIDVFANKLGREIYKPDSDLPPPNNVFKRSDHFPFVKKGVPAMWNIGNFGPINGDSKEEEKIGDYVRNHYHKASDEFYEGFNSSNIAFDAQLNFLIGLEISNSSMWPNWKNNKFVLEYKKIRDESLQKNN